MNQKRILNSIKSDIKFQAKHGFYAIYVVLSLAYIIILSFIPPAARGIVLPILIYTDPAGLGLFFIGGMVLLEKEQGVLALLYITPLQVYEYITSKIITLGIISTIVAAIISLASVGTSADYSLLLLGTFLSSIFYTLVGFLIAAKSKTVNDYLVKMIPAMLAIILPCLSFIGNDLFPNFINHALLLVPSAAGLKLVLGAYHSISTLEVLISISSLIILNFLLVKRVYKVLTDKVILSA